MDIVFDKIPKTIYFDDLNMNNRKISINVIGAGGTGSYVISNLARINKVLTMLGRPGFHVTAFDTDIVSKYNVGRSLFSEADIGYNKAQVLIQRINRFFGYEWDYSEQDSYHSNILISCVDNVKTRQKIKELLDYITGCLDDGISDSRIVKAQIGRASCRERVCQYV